MANRAGRFSVFIKAKNSIDKSKEKRAETLAHQARLVEMQRLVDLSEEKIALLDEVIDSVIEKGVIVYIKLIEVVKHIKQHLESRGIKVLTITGETTQKARKEVSDDFMENPHNKVVIISLAGGESIDLNSTDTIILYDTPDGGKNFQQIIGRVCRGFGDFTRFNIHEIVVEETVDEYKQALLSSKREMEQTILNSDTIPLKHDVGSFDARVLKKVRDRMLWKLGKKKRKPKGIDN